MRDNLAGEIADRLRDLIADGALESGARINESEVSRQLEVSRTPLREGLMQLSAEGFVESRARRGFFVRRTDTTAVQSLYELRSILDPAALELSGLPPGRVLRRLEQLNGMIAEAGEDVERVIDLDDAWHLELVGRCPNDILLTLIRRFMVQTRPLERAYVRAHGAVEGMVREHERILEVLRKGELASAVEALRQNMQSGLEPILRWFREERPTAKQMRR